MFLVAAPFASCCLACRKDAYSCPNPGDLLKCVTHDEQSTGLIHPQCNPAIFTIAVLGVVLRERARIRKDIDRFFKGNFVLSRVSLSLARVPLKLKLELLIHERIVSRGPPAHTAT